MSNLSENDESKLKKQQQVEDEEEDLIPIDMFEEPEGFRPPPPPPTSETFKRNSKDIGIGEPSEITVRLVSQHSLWAHKLWNAGVSLARYLDQHKELYKNKNVLELGAAAGIPSLICSINGAKKVIMTDYPEKTLLDNMNHNCEMNVKENHNNKSIIVEGYQWGYPVDKLFNHLENQQEKFDLIILADLVFNHTEHVHLLESCLKTLSKNGIVLTSFTHHIVKYADRDLKFFEIAKYPEFNFNIEQIYVEKWDPMFPEDPGDVNVRSTVQCFKLWK